jgi:3-oxoadipate enol-lactonase
VVVGDEDLGGILDAYEYLVAHLPAAEGTVMMNAAHLPSVEHPAEFRSVLLDWLARKHR